jgi:hypothetical protein
MHSESLKRVAVHPRRRDHQAITGQRRRRRWRAAQDGLHPVAQPLLDCSVKAELGSPAEDREA